MMMTNSQAVLKHSKSGQSFVFKFSSKTSFKLLLFFAFVGRATSRSFVETEFNHRRHQAGGTPDSDPARYLQKYGYLPGSDFETGALRTEEEFGRAIIEFQRFAKLSLTGKLDRETVAKMNQSRCGNRDYLEGRGHQMKYFPQSPQSLSASSGTSSNEPQQYFLGPSKWQKKWLSFRLLNYTPDMSRESARDAVIRAFHVWSKVIPISFHEIDSGYADIYIQFSPGYHQDGYPFDGKGGILAHAFFPGEERGGDVHFDEDEHWTVYSETGTNLFIVAAHELGHSLGLAHSNVLGSLMYPWHQGYKPNFQLHYDDILAIQSLYGSKTPYVNPATPKTATTTTTTTTTTFKPVSTKSTSRPTTTTTRTTTTTTTTTTTSTKRSPTTSKSSPTSTHPTHRHHKNHHHDDDCDTHIDAASIIRGELFIFKADKFWRINKSGLVSKVPSYTSLFWKGVPKYVERVDAVFERPSDNKIVFFSGKLYWELQGTTLANHFPSTGRSITDFGLPKDLDKIDAAFVWGHNRKVYIISGDMYWRLNDTTRQVDYSYPRDMSMWEGVKLPVDAAFTNKEGVTYFFHGPHFWEFNDARMKLRHEHHPSHIGQNWLNCTPSHTFPGHEKQSGDESIHKNVEATSSAPGCGINLGSTMFVIVALMFLIRCC